MQIHVAKWTITNTFHINYIIDKTPKFTNSSSLIIFSLIFNKTSNTSQIIALFNLQNSKPIIIPT